MLVEFGLQKSKFLLHLKSSKARKQRCHITVPHSEKDMDLHSVELDLGPQKRQVREQAVGSLFTEHAVGTFCKGSRNAKLANTEPLFLEETWGLFPASLCSRFHVVINT